MKEPLPEKGTISELMSALGKRRIALLNKEGRRELAAKAGKAGWAGMTQGQRILEMKRRQKNRMKNRAKKVLAKIAAAGR